MADRHKVQNPVAEEDKGCYPFPVGIPRGTRFIMSDPVICFGQQPCGFFPKRFFHAKLATARRLREEIGGRILYFCHDSDHDYRETTTPLRDLRSGEMERLNFDHVSKIQKKYSPLYAKHIRGDWQERTARLLPRFVAPPLVEVFQSVRADTAADFCLGMYRRLGLLDGIEVVRSGDPELRRRAVDVSDYYVDIMHEGELVRARSQDGKLVLHRGGDQYLEIPFREVGKESISPARDTRLVWMQSVVRCTHYVAGASEMQYLNRDETPEIAFVERDAIDRPHESFVEFPLNGQSVRESSARPDALVR
jgi:hypothetical protein